MAYSATTLFTLYSLASLQDFWADKVDRFISMATCMFWHGYEYEGEVHKYQLLADAGFTNWNGGDSSSAYYSTICDYINDPVFACGTENENDDDELPQNAESIKLEMHWSQIMTEQRFQEFQTLDNWANGDRIT